MSIAFKKDHECACFCTDSGRSSSSTKGERLSAKMRSLPGSNEPYEASSPKELGEETIFFSAVNDITPT